MSLVAPRGAGTVVALTSRVLEEVGNIRRALAIVFCATSVALVVSAAPARGDPGGTDGWPSDGNGTEGVVPGSYTWPVAGPVIRSFLPPDDPYGPGHRGIDIAVPFGSPVHAANDGVVAFAGYVGGSLFVSIDHPDGVRTTYSWLSAVSVRKGQIVRAGDVIASTGHGHPEVPTPHLHFGARIGSTYIDPMMLLGGATVVDLIRLAPLSGQRR